MDFSDLRLLLPPVLILIASLVQRRSGERLGGLVAGLPLTSGSFLALLLPVGGRGTVAVAATGVLCGQLAVVVFASTFAWCAPRAPRWASPMCAVGAWVLVTLAVGGLGHPGLVVGLHALLAAFVFAVWPATGAAAPAAPGSGRAEIVTRVVAVTVIVAGLSAMTGLVGATIAGLLVAAPVLVAILAPTTQRSHGTPAVRELLRGVVLGSLAAAIFAATLVLWVERLGVWAFTLAVVLGGVGAVGLGRLGAPGSGQEVARRRRASAAGFALPSLR